MSDTDTELGTDSDTTDHSTDDVNGVEGSSPDDQSAEADDNVEPDDDGKEAAKYRRRLRDTEAQRDALAARVEALQRQNVESILADAKIKPAAVWAVTELADMLAEDGTVDADSVAAAVATARERFNIARPAKGNVVPGVGNRPSVPPKVDAWKEAFTPPRNR